LDQNDSGPGGNSGRQLIAAVIVVAVIVLAGLWLSGALRRDAGVQDCVMSGRSNCAPVGGH
jgi:hypothetical protein